MENKIELEVEFWQKVKYSGTIKVTPEEAELLKDADGGDIEQYLRSDGNIDSNPLYELLQDLANDSNATDWDDELEDFTITEDWEHEV